MESLNIKMTVQEQRESMLGILDDIKRFCFTNDISWSLGYGSMLGAVRHHGFIPWDDDVDIWMKRNDYERFIKEYSSAHFSILNYRNKKAVCAFSKVVDNNTYLYEDGLTISQPDMGIFVDIFPLDNIYTDEGEALNARMFYYNFMLLNSKIKKYGYCNSLKRNIILPVLKFFTLPFNYYSSLASLEKKAIKYKDKKSLKYAILLDTAINEFPAELFDDTIQMPFEGHMYPVYSEADKILSILYGDYMQLPDEDDRIVHRIVSYRKTK